MFSQKLLGLERPISNLWRLGTQFWKRRESSNRRRILIYTGCHKVAMHKVR